MISDATWEYSVTWHDVGFPINCDQVCIFEREGNQKEMPSPEWNTCREGGYDTDIEHKVSHGNINYIII